MGGGRNREGSSVCKRDDSLCKSEKSVLQILGRGNMNNGRNSGARYKKLD